MKVLEIKNNLVKIAYDTNDNLALSGFVIIEDSNTPYVGQVMNLKADSNGNFAIVKLLFTFNEEGILKNYNGTIPSLKSTVSSLPSKELLDVIPVENPVKLGKLQDTALNIDKSILENNLLICSGNFENSAEFIETVMRQIDEKVVIIDTEGLFDTENKITFTKDFKLALNYDTINYIYDNELEDVDAVNKAVIQDIFLEVQEYSKTLPEGHLPFESFYNVVDAQYKQTKIPQLVLLKNKLQKFRDQNIFAQDLKDVLSLNIAVETNNPVVIDISNIEEKLQKEVISYIYKVLTSINTAIFSFIKINNDNSDKRTLKTLIAHTNVNTTIICAHEYKYINELKEIAQNLVLFAPQTLQHDFASYNSYLNKLNSNEFVIYGAHTQNIPLIVELADINTLDEPEEKVENIKSNETVIEEEPVEEFENNDSPVLETVFDEPVIQESYEENEIMFDENIIEPLKEEEEFNTEEIITDEPINILSENYDENIEPTEEELVEQVVKDVDRAFYEKLPNDEEFEETDNTEDISSIIFSTDDELTEDDLNLIEDLGAEDLVLPEELPELEEEIPPVVPIYPVDDVDDSDVQTFEPGDRISTPKYGEGVVQKMIKYGNKMLCSIDFPNIGRRLLDPAITEITKLEN